MSLHVICLCTYRTSNPRLWRDRDFAACKLIRALKGRAVSGWADVPIGPRDWVRLDRESVASAADIFGRIAAGVIAWPPSPAFLVPIPNSCTLVNSSPPKTKTLADALAKHAPNARLTVADVLRWHEPVPVSHQGAARYPEQLYPNLRLTEHLQTGSRVILVDDMLTTGGHMRAAAAFVEHCGAEVTMGICAGRSDESLVSDAFAVRVETLERFTFDPSVFDNLCESSSGPAHTVARTVVSGISLPRVKSASRS